jgi:hypothetical protein
VPCQAFRAGSGTCVPVDYCEYCKYSLLLTLQARTYGCAARTASRERDHAARGSVQVHVDHGDAVRARQPAKAYQPTG